MALRSDPVAQLAAGRPRPSQRMMRLHHRLPQPAVGGVAHRIERDRAEILPCAGQTGVGNVFGWDGGSNGRIRHVAGRRKIEPEALRSAGSAFAAATGTAGRGRCASRCARTVRAPGRVA